MDTILKAFDPETGQVSKDNQGKIKIKVVIDWPIIAGLLCLKYKRYFKWAKHFKNYHADITEETFCHINYHPIRYQTETYDEREIGLSVFCQQERRFLEGYLWLCQAPNCKPMELLCAMENKQAQEEAAKILQNS